MNFHFTLFGSLKNKLYPINTHGTSEIAEQIPLVSKNIPPNFK